MLSPQLAGSNNWATLLLSGFLLGISCLFSCALTCFKYLMVIFNKTYLLRLSRLFKILSFLLCILKSIYMSLFLAFSYDHTTHLVQAQLQDGYK